MSSSSSNKSSQASTNSQTTNNSDSSLSATGGNVISNSTIQSLDAVIVDKAMESNRAVAQGAFDLSSSVAGSAIDRTTALARDLSGQTADVAGNAIDRSTSLARDLAGQNANVATNALDFTGSLTRDLLGGAQTTFRDLTAAYQKTQADNTAFQVGLVNDYRAMSEGTNSTLRDALSATLNSAALAKPADHGAPTDATPSSEKSNPLIWAAVIGGLILIGRN